MSKKYLLADFLKMLKNDIKKGVLSSETEKFVKRIMPGIIIKQPLIIPTKTEAYDGDKHGSTINVTTNIQNVSYLAIYNEVEQGKTVPHFDLLLYLHNNKMLKIRLKDFSDIKRFREKFDIDGVETQIQNDVFATIIRLSYYLYDDIVGTYNPRAEYIIEFLKEHEKSTIIKDNAVIIPQIKWSIPERKIQDFDDFLNSVNITEVSSILEDVRTFRDKEGTYNIAFKYIIDNKTGKGKMEVLQAVYNMNKER